MVFRLIFEIEPPRQPDLDRLRRQAEIFGPLVDAILVPDNHLGRPAMSSVAIAIELKKMGFNPVVGLNARDRNFLRLESDLLTLQAYGIDEVLFLYGDPIARGRTGLQVKNMLSTAEAAGFKKGALAQIGRPLGWRSKADFLLTKLDFGRSRAGKWKAGEGFTQPLYCGVLALPDVTMARKILKNIPDLRLPSGYLEEFERDGDHGFKTALDELDQLVECGVNGAQLVVPAHRRQFADLLKKWKSGRGIK
ncbi:MAG: methylenetetrahydrofolate reductase [Actinomycetota bacterium]